MLGNEAWIDFDAGRSKKWIREVEDVVKQRLPDYVDHGIGERLPKLFIKPSALRYLKPAIYAQGQRNLAVMRMEREMVA